MKTGGGEEGEVVAATTDANGVPVEGETAPGDNDMDQEDQGEAPGDGYEQDGDEEQDPAVDGADQAEPSR